MGMQTTYRYLFIVTRIYRTYYGCCTQLRPNLSKATRARRDLHGCQPRQLEDRGGLATENAESGSRLAWNMKPPHTLEETPPLWLEYETYNAEETLMVPPLPPFWDPPLAQLEHECATIPADQVLKKQLWCGGSSALPSPTSAELSWPL